MRDQLERPHGLCADVNTKPMPSGTRADHPTTPAAGRVGEEAISAAIAHFDLDVIAVGVGTGSYSSTVRLLTLRTGERIVLKIPYVRQKLHREITALEALKSDLPVPALLDVWVPEDETPGAMLISCLPGDTADGKISAALAREMGALIARMHRHRLPQFGEVHPRPGTAVAAVDQDWWALMISRFDLWRAHCETAMPTDLFADSMTLYSRLVQALPQPDGPVWTHHDYRPGNILVQSETITGLIDFESARGGSADLDFVKISHSLWETEPDTKQNFLEGYAAIRPLPPFEQTLPFYQLHNALGGVAWCVRRTDNRDPFFHENMAVIRALTARYAQRSDSILPATDAN